MRYNGIFLVSGAPDGAGIHAAVAEAFAGWRIGRGMSGCPAHEVARFDADLIVIDGDWPLVAAIRSLDHAVARVPIVAVAVAVPTIDGVDDHMAAPTAEALAALVKRWTPEPLPALERLAEALGAAEIARLAIGLRDQLDGALRSLDDGEGDRALAHRVAGFAGMLGLTELGQGWNAMSHGRHGDLPALRIATRRAIAALDRASPVPLV